MSEQKVPVNLKVGSRVSVMNVVDVEEDGFAAKDVFHDEVTQYVPETNKLEFAESDMGYAEFIDLLDKYDSVQVVKE